MRFLLNGLLLGLLSWPAQAQSPAPATPAPASAPRPAAPQRPAGPAAGSPAPAPAAASVDVNLATADELQTLPGIGPARAAAIVTHRPYTTPQEIVSKAAVPQSVLTDMLGRVTATQMNVNSATKRQMIDTLPGIGDARADAIIRARPYARPEELVSKAGVPQAVFDRIRPAITLR